MNAPLAFLAVLLSVPLLREGGYPILAISYVHSIPFWLSIAATAGIVACYWQLTDEPERTYATLLVVISPLTLHLAYVTDGLALAAFLMLLALVLYRQEHALWSVVATLLILAASLQHIAHLFAALAAIPFLRRPRNIGMAFGLAVGGIILHLPTAVQAWNTPAISFFSYGSVFTDLGGIAGLGLFMTILGLFGYQRRQTLVIVIGLLLLAPYSRVFILYAHFLLAYGGAQALLFLQQRKWAIKDLRWLTFVLIGCGILFSTLAYARILSDAQPTPAFQTFLDEVVQRTDPNSTILTAPSYAPFLANINRSAYLPLQGRSENLSARVNISQQLFHTYDLARARNLLAQEHITHLLISPAMLDGLTWEEPGRELHFLLQNRESFKKIEEHEGYTLWEVRKV